jgi:flavin-dependent dehydrogenase
MRQAGAEVTIVDRAQPVIDKACGEGLMPDSLMALGALGVHLPPNCGFSFNGVRFVDAVSTVRASFPSSRGMGVRRTVLHRFLIEHAEAEGVRIVWGARNVRLAPGGVTASGCLLRAGFIVGADGQHSQIRRQAGLDHSCFQHRRYGFRRHYGLAPWSDYLEIYWGAQCQAYITPVSENEVCVVTISSNPRLRQREALAAFPGLNKRLQAATASSSEMGAVSVSRRLKRVWAGNVALVGDASGSVDAVTGEGMCLGFRQAGELARAVREGKLEDYEAGHARLSARPRAMASLLLLLERNQKFQCRALASLAAHPSIFDSLLRIHVGESSFHDLFSWKLLPFGMSFLAA